MAKVRITIADRPNGEVKTIIKFRPDLNTDKAPTPAQFLTIQLLRMLEKIRPDGEIIGVQGTPRQDEEL